VRQIVLQSPWVTAIQQEKRKTGQRLAKFLPCSGVGFVCCHREVVSILAEETTCLDQSAGPFCTSGGLALHDLNRPLWEVCANCADFTVLPKKTRAGNDAGIEDLFYRAPPGVKRDFLKIPRLLTNVRVTTHVPMLFGWRTRLFTYSVLCEDADKGEGWLHLAPLTAPALRAGGRLTTSAFRPPHAPSRITKLR